METMPVTGIEYAFHAATLDSLLAVVHVMRWLMAARYPSKMQMDYARHAGITVELHVRLAVHAFKILSYKAASALHNSRKHV